MPKKIVRKGKRPRLYRISKKFSNVDAARHILGETAPRKEIRSLSQYISLVRIGKARAVSALGTKIRIALAELSGLPPGEIWYDLAEPQK